MSQTTEEYRALEIELDNKEKAKKQRITTRGLGRMFSFARPYWMWLVGGAVAMLVGSLTGLTLPALAGSLIDTVFVRADANGLNLAAATLLGVFVIQAGAAFTQNYLLSFTGERIVTDIRVKLYTHLQKLPLGFFNERRTGELMSRLTNDVTLVQNAVTVNLIGFLGNVVLLTGAIAVIIVSDWRLTLLILALLPALVFLAMTVGRRLRKLQNAVLVEYGNATTIMEETLSNQKTVKAFTREEFEIGRYSQKINMVLQLARKRVGVQSMFIGIMTFFSLSAVVAVLWFGGQEVLAGHITPGQLVSTLIYMGVAVGPIGAMAGIWSELQKSMGAAERIFELLDEPVTVTDEPYARPLPAVRGHLRFEEVEFAYDAQTPVLHQLTFEALPGQVVALVGPSGAGKTTIANLIPRFFDPTGGRITLDGYNIKQVQMRSLREQISSVLQEPVLFGTSIRENIVYGRLDASQQELEEAAHAANALEFINKLPQGFDTIVGERGVKLSGGQRQRVAIARAILRNPRLLILDEATSSLDNESESLVQEALEKLMRDRTTIVIAHRLSTIENADKIVVVDQGKVVEEGSHLELISREGLYYRLYTRNFQD